MNFNEAMLAVNSGKKVARQAWLDSMGANYQNGDDLDEGGLSREDFFATDWIVEPELALNVKESQIVAAWNSSLPPGSPEMNLAPNSARYKRFIEALRG